MKMETRSRAIDKLYKRRDRIEMPDFQREEVWPVNKKRLLIDSILKGWHLPKFYFRKSDDGTLECVDGQQRLSAIFSFFDNNLTLSDETASQSKARSYSELDDDCSDAFDDFEIEIEEIEDASDWELEELFKRLQLGEPLNTAEKINAIQGELRDFCHEIACKPFFAERIGIKNTRYAHFETVVKWVFVEARGIQPQMRYPQLESLLTENRTFSRSSDTAKRIDSAANFLGRAFSNDCRMVRNRANALSVCMLASRVYVQNLTSDMAPVVFRDFVQTFFSNLSDEVEKGSKAVDKELLRYQQAITAGSTGGDSIRARIAILMSRLAAHSPNFSPLLSSYQEARDAANVALEDTHHAVRQLIYEVNTQHAARNGEDCFRMTTKSSKALDDLGRILGDINSFGDFIDAIYFLIYEGSGNGKRFGETFPNMVEEIKCLRTDIRHDLDHGKETIASKKHLRHAELMQKYTGKRTREECGPEELMSGQFRILREMVSFLTNLKSSY